MKDYKYFQMDGDVWRSQDLTLTEKVLHMQLLTMSNEQNGELRCTLKYLAYELGVNKGNLSTYLKKLHNMGFLYYGEDGLKMVATFNNAANEQCTTLEQISVRKFIAPSVEEVGKYIGEMGYHFNAEQFVAFYQSKGWKVGTTPMKDWKSACVTWEKRHQDNSTEREKTSDALQRQRTDLLNKYGCSESDENGELPF